MSSDSPQRSMRAELRDLPRSLPRNVDGDADDADKRPEKDDRDQPTGDRCPHGQRLIKGSERGDGGAGVEEYLRDPGHEDDHEDEDVVALQAAAHRLEGADLE